MKKFIALVAALSVASTVALAQGTRGKEPQRGQPQRGEPQRGQPPRAPQPQVGGGHIPSRGPQRSHQPQPRKPEPPRRNAPTPPPPAPVQHNYAHERGHPNAPHVDVRTNAWFGHDDRRWEPGLHMSNPWAHGRFYGEFGPNHIYRLGGGNARRFGFGGYFFEVAPVDLVWADNWFWDSDDIVLYEDPDHIGYYIAYNTRLGTYVHVELIG